MQLLNPNNQTKMKKLGTLLLILLITVTSCKDEKKIEYKPESIGAINAVAVVMDNEL